MTEILGGKEYLPFEGIEDLSFNTIRNYYKNSKMTQKSLLNYGVNHQKIATRYRDMPNANYLKSLLMSLNVQKLEASYATPTPVTITTANVEINKGIEFFDNTLDMEYDY